MPENKNLKKTSTDAAAMGLDPYAALDNDPLAVLENDPYAALDGDFGVEPAPLALAQPERTIGGTLGDIGVTGLKSAVGLVEAGIGLADIPTLGYAGKAAEALGIRTKDTQDILENLYSPAQKYADKQVSDAKGFVDTVGAGLSNPSTILKAAGESAALMGGGGVIARGVLAAKGITLANATAGQLGLASAIGEGAVGAGSAAEGSRQGTTDGLLTPKQSALAIATGITTGAFNRVGSKLANKFGFDDIDQVIARGARSGETTSKTIGRRMAEGGISEGLFEELPQSVAETILSNAAMDLPLMQGVPEGAAMGLLTGGAMGMAINARPTRKPNAPIGNALDQAQLALPAPGQVPILAGYDNQDEAQAERTEADGQRLAQRFFNKANPGKDEEIDTTDFKAQAIASGQSQSAVDSFLEGLDTPIEPNTTGLQDGINPQDVISQQEEGKLKQAQMDSDFEGREQDPTQPAKDFVTFANEKGLSRKERKALRKFMADQQMSRRAKDNFIAKLQEGTDQNTQDNTQEESIVDIALKEASKLKQSGEVANTQLSSALTKAINEPIISGNTNNDINTNGSSGSTESSVNTDGVGNNLVTGRTNESEVLDGASNTEAGVEATHAAVPKLINQTRENINEQKETESKKTAVKAESGEQINEIYNSSITPTNQIKATEAEIESGVIGQSQDSSKPLEQTVASPAVKKEAILTQKKNRYINNQIKAAGLNKNSPGYDNAVNTLQKQYNKDLEKAEFSLPFEEFKKLPGNRKQSDGVVREVYDTVRAELGIQTNKTQDNNEHSPETKKSTTNTAAVGNGEPTATRVPDGASTTNKEEKVSAPVEETTEVLANTTKGTSTRLDRKTKKVSPKKRNYSDSRVARENDGDTQSFSKEDPSADQRDDVQAVFTPSKKLTMSAKLGGMTASPMTELKPTNKSVRKFLAGMKKAKAGKFGAAVFVYEASEYKKMRMFLSSDGQSGFAVKPDGDIVSVFNHAGGGRVNPMMELAVQEGGTKLDAFDTALVDMYELSGFKPTKMDPWDEAYKPAGWSKETFKDFNNGEPGVVYMVHEKDYSPSNILASKKTKETSNDSTTGKEQQSRDGSGRSSSRDTSRLEGAPEIKGASGQDKAIVEVAQQYAKDNGIDLKRQSDYVEVDFELAKRIAQAYEDMEHKPSDPVVAEAYQNLIKQTRAQYDALVKAGYEFYFVNAADAIDFLSSPFNAMRELRQAKKLGVFPTVDGFGEENSKLDVSDNPLLADTGIVWNDIQGNKKKVLANDLFRAVHDVFGHGTEGSGFRARGEENAWQAHRRLFTGSAVAAITSETRGQNSWLNYGIHGETNQTAQIEDTIFADQKTGLMPEFTWTEGVAGDEGVLQSNSDTKTGSTVEQIEALIPRRTKKLLDSGRLEVVQSVTDISDNSYSFTSNDGLEGFYDPKTDKLYLVADMLDKENFSSVLNHELFHRARRTDKKLKRNLAEIDRRLQARFNLAAEGKGTAAEQAAYKRVMDANTPAKNQLEEFQAYMITDYNQSPRSLSASMRRLMKDLISLIRASLIRQGVPLKNITASDLNALAQYGSDKQTTSVASAGDTLVGLASRKGYKGNSTKGAKAFLTGDIYGRKASNSKTEVLASTAQEVKNERAKRLEEIIFRKTGKDTDDDIDSTPRPDDLLASTAEIAAEALPSSGLHGGRIIKQWSKDLQKEYHDAVFDVITKGGVNAVLKLAGLTQTSTVTAPSSYQGHVGSVEQISVDVETTVDSNGMETPTQESKDKLELASAMLGYVLDQDAVVDRYLEPVSAGSDNINAISLNYDRVLTGNEVKNMMSHIDVLSKEMGFDPEMIAIPTSKTGVDVLNLSPDTISTDMLIDISRSLAAQVNGDSKTIYAHNALTENGYVGSDNFREGQRAYSKVRARWQNQSSDGDNSRASGQHEPKWDDSTIESLRGETRKVTEEFLGKHHPQNKKTTRQFAELIDARVKSENGTLDVKDYSEKAIQTVTSKLLSETQAILEGGDKDAIGWYTSKYNDAINLLSRRFPEFKKNGDARNLFTAIVAITSDGTSVKDNLKYAVKIYKEYKKTGKLDSVGLGGERAASYKANLKLLSGIIDEHGVDGMVNYLTETMTAGELEKESASILGKPKTVGYPNETIVPRSMLFGDKLGAFFANLMGHPDYLTMDRWWSRTFNRLRGQMRANPATDSSWKRLAEAIRKEHPEEKLAKSPRKATLQKLATKYQKTYKASGFKDKTATNKIANTIMKAETGLRDIPDGKRGRAFMLEVSQRVTEELKKEYPDMTVADMQAVVWFGEKRLFNENGVISTKASAESDYSDAAANLVEDDAPVDRKNMSHSDVLKRVPQLTEAAKQLEQGTITKKEYAEVVKKYKPIFKIDELPDSATNEQMTQALTKDKVERIGMPVKTGERVGLRLDIPAYKESGVWIPATHVAGSGNSFNPTARITDVKFLDTKKAALNVATGAKSKSPFATIKGSYVQGTTEENRALAKEAMNSPEWIQVGFDPERHSYFYDRTPDANGHHNPVAAADEAIQIGQLVLAKNPVYANEDEVLFSRKAVTKEAHAVAQKNATLPKSQGGLGLPANNTAKDRARAMGFDVDTVWYRGVTGDLAEANGSLQGRDTYNGQRGGLQFFSENPDMASTFANTDAGRVYPVYLKLSDVKQFPVGKEGRFSKTGFDDAALKLDEGQALMARKVIDSGAYVDKTLDPNSLWSYNADQVAIRGDKNIRSIHAAFDPMLADEPTLLYSIKSTAQKNAALPKSKGGLGLPEGNTAKDRARAMGFDVDTTYYRGTTEAWSEDGDLTGVYYTSDPEYASSYSDGEEGQMVIPVFLNTEHFKIETDINDVTDWNFNQDELAAQGYTGVMHETDDVAFIFSDKYRRNTPKASSNIRSIHAAFDPMLADDSNLLASTIEKRKPVKRKPVSKRKKAPSKIKGTNATWRDRPGFEGVTEAGFAALGKIGAPLTGNFVEKTKAAVKDASTLWRRKVRQYGVDQFDSFKNILGDKESWMMAHISGTGSSVVEALTEFGRPLLDWSGAVKVDMKKKSLAQIFEPLGTETDRFLMWVAGNRAEGLKVDDKEHLFNHAEIAELKRLSDGTKDGKSRLALYKEVLVEFEAMHNAVVQIGVDTGLVSKEDAKIWKDQGFYVPFYRIAEESSDHQGKGVPSASGLQGQEAYKKLKGADMQLDDLLVNTMMNWTHLIGASLKNQAASKALVQAVKLGIATPVKESERGEKAIFVRVNGQKQYYDIVDTTEGRLVLDSLTSLNFDGLNGTLMKVMRKFKRALTIGVTASPEFKVANLLRDTLQAIAVADMSTNIGRNLVEGYKATSKDNPIIAQMIAGGGAFGDSGYISGGDPDAIKASLKKGIPSSSILNTDSKIKKMWDAYQDVGARAENINRAANFKQALEKGKSLLEANFEARDHLDFTRSGSAVSVRAISQMVPFLNARLQGLDKLSRAAMDPEQKGQFAAVVGMYSLASVLLYLAMRGDEDYEEAEDWERDTYHLFKLPGSDIMYRFPRPFEVGAIGSMAERFVEQLVDDKVHGELFAERLMHTIFQTFAMNPTPQLFKPLVETWANKSWFTGRGIESQSMERLSKVNRKKAWTSQTAIGLSTAMDAILWDDVVLSPVQIDHLVKGYLGWLGATTLAGIDTLARPALGVAEAPDMEIQDLAVVGRFAREGKARNSKFISQFYENQRDLNQKFADIKHYRDNQEYKKAAAALQLHGNELRNRKAFNRVGKRLSDINKKIRLITASKRMSGAAKRVAINRLNRQRILITKRAARLLE